MAVLKAIPRLWNPLLHALDKLEPKHLVKKANAWRGRLLLSTLVIVYSYTYWASGMDLRGMWHLFSIGYTVLVFGFWASRDIRQRMEATIDHLAGNEAIRLTREWELAGLKEKLEKDAAAWSHRSGVAISILLLAGYTYTYQSFSYIRMVETFAGILMAYPAGRTLGRMAAYGFIGRFFASHGISVKSEPGHIDGAAGFKPLGDFYFFQAMLVAIAALFLGIWSLLFSVTPSFVSPNILTAVGWRDAYAALFVIAMFIELLAFFWPMSSIHRDMGREKNKLRFSEGAQLGREISALKRRLAGPLSKQDRDEVNDQLREKSQRYLDIETMPTWPVTFKTVRNFGIVNAVVTSIPLLGNVNLVLETWDKIRQMLSPTA